MERDTLTLVVDRTNAIGTNEAVFTSITINGYTFNREDNDFFANTWGNGSVFGKVVVWKWEKTYPNVPYTSWETTNLPIFGIVGQPVTFSIQ